MGSSSTVKAKAEDSASKASSEKISTLPSARPSEAETSLTTQEGETSSDAERLAQNPQASSASADGKSGAADDSADVRSAADGANSLAEELDNLKIRPDESDQVGTTVAEGECSSSDEEPYTNILQKMREVFSREKKSPKEVLEPLLETFDLAGIAEYIQKGKAKHIVVMTGAGISVSAGIPDFRSPKTGLYQNLKKYNLPHPQAVFELDYFRQEPKAFYQLAKELFPGRYKPTPAHHFITLLDRKGVLLRCFTQNIDSLEREAKLPSEKLVAAHGNFDTAHCISCRSEVSQEIVRKAVDEGRVCTCPVCDGYVKPDIVFFGENLPENFFRRAQSDFPKADLLIVMGTSLVVNPFASLIDHVGGKVPRVLINRERVGEVDAALLFWDHKKGFSFDERHRDALFLGDCDDGVRQLAELLGWESELEELINASGQQTESNVP